jgi:hypothetical protein
VPRVEPSVRALASTSTSTVPELTTTSTLLSEVKSANVDPAIRLKHIAIVRIEEIIILFFIFSPNNKCRKLKVLLRLCFFVKFSATSPKNHGKCKV